MNENKQNIHFMLAFICKYTIYTQNVICKYVMIVEMSLYSAVYQINGGDDGRHFFIS